MRAGSLVDPDGDVELLGRLHTISFADRRWCAAQGLAARRDAEAELVVRAPQLRRRRPGPERQRATAEQPGRSAAQKRRASRCTPRHHRARGGRVGDGPVRESTAVEDTASSPSTSRSAAGAAGSNAPAIASSSGRAFPVDTTAPGVRACPGCRRRSPGRRRRRGRGARVGVDLRRWSSGDARTQRALEDVAVGAITGRLHRDGVHGMGDLHGMPLSTALPDSGASASPRTASFTISPRSSRPSGRTGSARDGTQEKPYFHVSDLLDAMLFVVDRSEAK